MEKQLYEKTELEIISFMSEDAIMTDVILNSHETPIIWED